jgi:fructosamine-3-kinase
VDEETAARLERLLAVPLQAAHSLGGHHGVSHYRLELADGRAAFAKISASSSTDMDGNESAPAAASRSAADTRGGSQTGAGFAAEAAGLRWLAEPAQSGRASVPVPPVLAFDDSCLVIAWLPAGAADRTAAARFGRELAALHAAGADHFGAPWPGVIAGLPLPNDEADSWPDWYAQRRLLPYAKIALDAGTLSAADAALIESVAARIGDLAGRAEPPSRIHGDCWSGNVLWSGGQGWLVDPAAHGGHRETDLAMLALFGAPLLDVVLGSYNEAAPLADGWRARVPLHQLHPLLVHVCLFGSAYRDSALAAAHAVLA